MTEKQFSKGDVIFKEGDQGSACIRSLKVPSVFIPGTKRQESSF